MQIYGIGWVFRHDKHLFLLPRNICTFGFYPQVVSNRLRFVLVDESGNLTARPDWALYKNSAFCLPFSACSVVVPASDMTKGFGDKGILLTLWICYWFLASWQGQAYLVNFAPNFLGFLIWLDLIFDDSVKAIACCNCSLVYSWHSLFSQFHVFFPLQ
jgi:hypothetical protein